MHCYAYTSYDQAIRCDMTEEKYYRENTDRLEAVGRAG